MSETFSYDNTPETEVLSEEEQNSLEVGEQLVAEHEGLLAGKYKSAEDLEAAYLSCLLYTSPSPRDVEESRMPSSA